MLSIYSQVKLNRNYCWSNFSKNFVSLGLSIYEYQLQGIWKKYMYQNKICRSYTQQEGICGNLKIQIKFKLLRFLKLKFRFLLIFIIKNNRSNKFNMAWCHKKNLFSQINKMYVTPLLNCWKIFIIITYIFWLYMQFNERHLFIYFLIKVIKFVLIFYIVVHITFLAYLLKKYELFLVI